MSIEKMTTVLYHAKVGGSAKLVLLGIANHEGDGGAYPSVDTLARYANIDRRQTQRILRALEDSGYLVSYQREGTSTLYRVIVSCPENCDRSTNHREIRGGGVDDTGDTQTAPGGGVQTAGGAVSVPPEPSYNRQNKPNPQFETFWQNYPKKLDKARAQQVFDDLTDLEQIRATETAKLYALATRQVEDKYVAYPANWLLKRKFEDEYKPDYEAIENERREQRRKQQAEQDEAARKQREIDRAKGLYEIPKCEYDETKNILHCEHEECRNPKGKQ